MQVLDVVLVDLAQVGETVRREVLMVQQPVARLRVGIDEAFLAAIIHEKCAIKAKPLIPFTTMRMGCLMKFFAMKSLAQVFGGLGRFRAVR